VLLALVVIAILGRGLTNVVIAVGIASIPSYTRLVRSQVIAAKELAYVEAARVVGSSPGRVMMRHLLPNVLGPVTVLATLSIASAILSAAGLSYLGLGAQPPTPEWGAMVSDGREHLRSYWWMSTMPGFAIMLTVLAINLVGDGLRDAFDPRLRR
jgi:peptide/nickel transport system permease protein